jgi:O-antigen/teichoic acid export membrane protein
LILPTAFGTTLLAARIIGFIYPSTPLNDFSPAALALQVLIWSSLFSFLNYLFLNALQSTAFEKKISLAVALAVVLNIVLNLFLIPLYSFFGASIATVSSEIILFALGFFLTSKYLYRVRILRVLWKPLLASLVMSAFIWLFYSLNLFILLVSAAAVYFATFFLLKGFDRQDFVLIRLLLGRS